MTTGLRSCLPALPEYFPSLDIHFVMDAVTGALFAECPLPSDGTSLTTVSSDGTSLTTAVEPVVDSSRYFVIRVVDRDTSNHAFIGLGFRERTESSNFAASLDDYRLYLKRKREADRARDAAVHALGHRNEAASAKVSDLSEDHNAQEPHIQALHAQDLSLKGTITLNIKGLGLRQSDDLNYCAGGIRGAECGTVPSGLMSRKLDISALGLWSGPAGATQRHTGLLPIVTPPPVASIHSAVIKQSSSAHTTTNAVTDLTPELFSSLASRQVGSLYESEVKSRYTSDVESMASAKDTSKLPGGTDDDDWSGFIS
ncbi:hypothetical protein CEUSTIGMA_g10113.t1 [Chlamydomonas eustigma]|uniref:NECAP PHear domain-containing protein n=1 Tax=Chlamydomonas eustigma TaxID=1157962 RepID=A0A250XHX4_9CHLO|nr:hypothetical protein CEUSTIGMA_g10113.t1 [Chlamydomonas eustigma]|eukprot:GAX82687.1 hypothetical protein CEUSTIGMA_g10113.t1 [Chlamydomonas eustigma]